MARGVMTIAETQEEAEGQILESAPQVRVLRSREIDLSGLPPVSGGPLPRHWVVVVEHRDPEAEAALPQDADPEHRCERDTRQLYLKMAIDPELLTTGVIEEFACPACEADVRLELPPSRETRYPQNAQCRSCQSHLQRDRGELQWTAVEHPPRSYPRCMFCPARANSREHAVPAWISKRLGINELLSAEDAFIVGRTRPTQPISFANYRARVMCSDCNTHFKHLEDEVIALVVPMARGLTLSLDAESQQLLALWANKTALALMGAGPDQDIEIPEGHGEAVRAGHVAENTWVGFFSWHGGPIISTGLGDVVHRQEARSLQEAYGVILAFAGVGFYVVGFRDLPASTTLGGAPRPLIQVWPPANRLVHWPPPTVDNRIVPRLLGFMPLRSG